MNRTYFSYEEDEAYREGRSDKQHHRHNYERSRFSNDESDRAYFHGIDDESRAEKQRMLEEEEERQEMERQERLEMERYLQEQRQEESDYYDQIFDDSEEMRELEEMTNIDIDNLFTEDDDE